MLNIQSSVRVLELGASATLGMKAKTKALQDQGIKVISLAAGEPDFETPACIVQAAHQALDQGVGRYTGVPGNDALITAMREKFKRDQGLDYDKSQVLSSTGAKGSLSLAIDAVVNPGDEVIILKPYWVSYPEIVRLAGGIPVFSTPDLSSIQSALTPKTRLLILNTPNNPGGRVLSESFLRGLMSLLENTQVLVISDEIYEHLIFDGLKHVSPASLSQDAYSRTLVVNGVSKGYAMTGWRVGIVGGPQAWVSGMVKLQEQRYTCIPTICQQAAVYALKEPTELKSEIARMRQAYEHRRDVFMQEIAQIPNLECQKPEGAFYAFPNISRVTVDDQTFANRLLMESHVAVVPGTPFGAPGHLRISLASSLEDIIEGVRRIAHLLRS